MDRESEMFTILFYQNNWHRSKNRPQMKVCVNRFVPARFPNIEVFGDIVGSSFSTAVVGYAVSVSVAKVYATKHDYKIDGNQVSFTKHKSYKHKPYVFAFNM